MTLPRGFGSGSCIDCGRPKNFGETCVCKTKPKTNEIIIPLSKEKTKLYIWYAIFAILAIPTLYAGIVIHQEFLIFFVLLFGISSMLGAMIFDCIGYRPTRTKEEVLPWLIPFFVIKNKIKFKYD